MQNREQGQAPRPAEVEKAIQNAIFDFHNDFRTIEEAMAIILPFVHAQPADGCRCPRCDCAMVNINYGCAMCEHEWAGVSEPVEQPTPVDAGPGSLDLEVIFEGYDAALHGYNNSEMGKTATAWADVRAERENLVRRLRASTPKVPGARKRAGETDDPGCRHGYMDRMACKKCTEEG